MQRARVAWPALALVACNEPAHTTDRELPAATAHDSGWFDAATRGDAQPIAAPASGDASAQSAALPCEVQSVLAARCGHCHGANVQAGAPMPLVRHADFHATSRREQEPYYRSAAERIQRTGSGAMPPSSQPALSADEKATLLAWFEAGAPAADESCTVTQPDAALPALPAPDTDCDVSFELRATDGQGGPFPVPLEDDHYECFYFKAGDFEVNTDAQTLATSLAPLLDKTQVLHHWLLFASDHEEAPSGSHARCSGIHPGSYLMAAWLPGTPALVLPEGVGMEMPRGPTAQFILENHYNNSARFQDLEDDSGVRVCATRKPKPQHAAIHWLGSERIAVPPRSKGSASATCTPQQSEPIHILGIIPHMHRLGSYVNMTILRADGREERLHDAAFEFENQTYYPKDVVLQPGDRVRTRCDYNNTTTSTVVLGEKTSNEMCYMFTLAYPVGSMETGGDLVNPVTGRPIVEGPHRCMK